ncbi:MAG: carbohydrate-binding family 9-like protein [Candidatus Marinimicrobia bacterium]|nr:carbohydrate-binding family 9-like protein [Candidatus Neomarinimicrobiota bacterium]MDD5582477.1 carbohydrate-binding family 9-like protein [Candidatus Neomarinimicrobiota bacterium]
MSTKPIHLIPMKRCMNSENLLDLQNWEGLPFLTLQHIRPESSNHIPETKVTLFRDKNALYGKFSVQDCYVRCVHQGYQANVSKDSCVEFFLKPPKSKGYFNFEFNCGGALLCYFIQNPKKENGKRVDYDILSPEALKRVRRQSTLPAFIPVEITEPLFWELAFEVPFSLIEHFTPITEESFKDTWEANFYKCGDETSHPHWISWAPLPEKNFHRPDAFGILKFSDS